jgi:hypothetical protein
LKNSSIETFKAFAIEFNVRIVVLISPLSILPICSLGMPASNAN